MAVWLHGRRIYGSAAERRRRWSCTQLSFTHCASVWRLYILLLLFLMNTPQCARSQAVLPTVNVKILVLRRNDLPTFRDAAKAFYSGFGAALWSRNYTAADGVRVQTIKKEADLGSYATVLDQTLQQDGDVLALFGQFGDVSLQESLPVLKKYDFVSFAPFTGSSAVRGWNPHLYFVRVDPAAELLALLRYAVARLRVRRLGFMYLQGVSFGDSEYEQAVRVMREMGYELSGVFTVKSSLTGEADEREFDAAWEAFAETVPQAVIVFGSPIRDTAKFLNRMLTDSRTAGAYLLAPSTVQDIVADTWRAAVSAGGVKFVPGQVITSGTNPLAKDTSYEAIKRFQTVMRNYLKNSGQTEYTDTDHFLNDDKDGEMMVAGWVAGEVLMKALSNREWIKDRKTFMESLFDQRRYLIDDIVIGDYGGDCKESAEINGAACRCNQGGRTVYMKRFVENYRAEPLHRGLMPFLLSDCNVSYRYIPPVFSGSAYIMEDIPAAQYVFAPLKIGFIAAYKRYAQWWEKGLITMYEVPCTSAGAPAVLRSELELRRVHGIAGVATEAMLDVDDVTFVDPLFLEPRLTRFRRHVIHLQPTLEQQFFVHAEYLRSSAGSEVSAHAVIRSDEAGAVADVLRRSLVTFGGSLRSATLLGGGDELVRHLPREGDVFVVGVAAADVAAIAGHLAQHGGVRVFVAFSEFALLHADFVAAFSGSAAAAADRLVFATSLPHWNDVQNTESETAQQFIAAVPNATQRTPLSLMGFATTVLLRTVLPRMDKVSAELLADFFYKNVAITAYDMVYGPFADGVACAPAAVAKGCGVNYGATRISVWSLARALDPAVPVLFPATTPSMVYVEPTQDGLTKGQLAGVIVGCVLVIALVILVVVFLFCCRDSRDNVNAPKEPTDPVTLVFTDIESSTALWAACPELMPDAVATHHRLIRALIAKYRCYEVKTIGDSFMIACKSPFAAVQLAGELQRVFLHHDWRTSAIDDAYNLFEEDRAAEDDEYVPPTARLDAAVYGQYWRGLRVRVGMHTGLADIRHDEVTKGYDYYGGTSNTAARTESVANGGQVVLTRATYLALSTAEREQVSVTALGAVPLRGVPRPVEMYQLDAVPGRTFAALRLDREMDDLGGDDGTGSEFTLNLSQNLSMYGGASRVAAVLRTLVGAYPIAERLRVVTRMCERWNVQVGRVGRNVAVEDHVSRALDRLAVRLSQVLQRVGGGETPRFGVSQTTSDCRFFGWGASVTSDVMALLGPEGLRDDDEDQRAASTAASDSVSTVQAGKPRYWNFSRK